MKSCSCHTVGLQREPHGGKKETLVLCGFQSTVTFRNVTIKWHFNVSNTFSLADFHVKFTYFTNRNKRFPTLAVGSSARIYNRTAPLYFLEAVSHGPRQRRVGASCKAEVGKHELMGRLLKWQCFPGAYAQASSLVMALKSV